MSHIPDLCSKKLISGLDPLEMRKHGRRDELTKIGDYHLRSKCDFGINMIELVKPLKDMGDKLR